MSGCPAIGGHAVRVSELLGGVIGREIVGAYGAGNTGIARGQADEGFFAGGTGGRGGGRNYQGEDEVSEHRDRDDYPERYKAGYIHTASTGKQHLFH